MTGEVVYTSKLYDVGLMLRYEDMRPATVLARANKYDDGETLQYGSKDFKYWNGTDIYLTESEWRAVSYGKTGIEILKELAIIEPDEEEEVLQLRCKALCKKIHKKSNSPAFRGIQEGDIMDFSVKLKYAGVNGHGSTHAVYICCHNQNTCKISKLSFNQLGRILKSFDLEQIK